MPQPPLASLLARRRALGVAGSAGALAAVAAIAPGAVPTAATTTAATAAPKQAGGYQLTRHVLRYYETTKV